MGMAPQLIDAARRHGLPARLREDAVRGGVTVPLLFWLGYS